MSDKTVGIIGQKYEDRKTGKCGVLESRDEKYKTLMFRGDDGLTFSISNSSFRSNWRKVKEEVVETAPVETESVEEEVVESVVEETTESAEEIEPEVEAEAEPEETEVKPKKKRKAKSEKKEPTPSKSYEGVTDEEALANFVEDIMSSRKVNITNEADVLEVSVDDVLVIRIGKNDNGIYNLAMLPDVFTLSDWRGKLNTLSIQYKTGADYYLGVIVDTKESCIPEILDIITETVRDINVYGYTVEEDDCEEETNEED